MYRSSYHSPLGKIYLTADEIGLTGLCFEQQKYVSYDQWKTQEEREIPVFQETKRWLDVYFSGREPDFLPALHLCGTEFQWNVWNILTKIPYGKTTTYGAIAKEIAEDRNLQKMSAQAVGGAVGRNPIAIIVPCHRVLGAGGQLTGYAGGIERKKELLILENIIREEGTEHDGKRKNDGAEIV